MKLSIAKLVSKYAVISCILFSPLASLQMAHSAEPGAIFSLNEKILRRNLVCRIINERQFRVEVELNGRKRISVLKFIKTRAASLRANGKMRAAARLYKNWRRISNLRARCQELLSPPPVIPTPAAVTFAYYSTGVSINRINLQSLEEERNILNHDDSGVRGLAGIDFKSGTNELFLLDLDTRTISKRRNLTGIEQLVVDSTLAPSVFDLSDSQERLYFSNTQGVLHRIDVNGQNHEVLSDRLGIFVHQILVGSDERVLYLSDLSKIYRYSLTSRTLEQIFQSNSHINDFAVDPLTGDLLIALFGQNNLLRISSDGSTQTPITLPSGHYIFPNTNIRYLVRSDEFLVSTSRGLIRVRRDGTIVEIEDTLDNVFYPEYIAVDTLHDRVFVSATYPKEVYELDFLTGVSRKIIEPKSQIGDIAISDTTNSLFFRDYGKAQILRADPDGRNVRVVVDRLISSSSRNLTIHKDEQRIFWDEGSSIVSSDYDGGNRRVTHVTTGLHTYYTSQSFFSLDSDNNLLITLRHYNSSGPSTVQLGLLPVQTIDTHLTPSFTQSTPTVILEGDFYLEEQIEHSPSRDVYFIVGYSSGQAQAINPYSIYRLSRGSQTPSLVEGNLGRPKGIAFSPDNRSIYWTDDQSDSVYRKNLTTGTIESIGGEPGGFLQGIALATITPP